jgi:hypothetical protein
MCVRPPHLASADYLVVAKSYREVIVEAYADLLERRFAPLKNLPGR